MAEAAGERGLRFETSTEGTLTVAMSGRWTAVDGRATLAEVLGHVSHGTRKVACDDEGISRWDSTFLAFVQRLTAWCAEAGLSTSVEGLSDGARRLLRLAASVPAHAGSEHAPQREAFFSYVGGRAVEFVRSAGELLEFTGECLLSVQRWFRGRAIFRPVDLGLLVQETGVLALPIVSLISLLVGLILAFVGGYQLSKFGAQVFVAAGVSLGMVREMGPLMTGILLAGRTGAAYAAQIGTMHVSEEVDALETMGVSAFDFLVLPRVVALALMTPLLCLYADLLGIVGGATVAAGVYGIPWREYFAQTWSTVGVGDFILGLVKSLAFGMAVGLSGCLRGMQCGRSASAVGEATTSAVVTGIVSVIVVDSVAAVITTVLGF